MAVPVSAQIDCQIAQSSAITSVGDAWRYLLLNGKVLGKKHNLPPNEIILSSYIMIVVASSFYFDNI